MHLITVPYPMSFVLVRTVVVLSLAINSIWGEIVDIFQRTRKEVYILWWGIKNVIFRLGMMPTL